METQAAFDFTVPDVKPYMPVPIPAKCPKCGYDWVGKDAIVSPTLSNCLCFWCNTALREHRGERDFKITDKHLGTRMGRSVEAWLR